MDRKIKWKIIILLFSVPGYFDFVVVVVQGAGGDPPQEAGYDGLLYVMTSCDYHSHGF